MFVCIFKWGEQKNKNKKNPPEAICKPVKLLQEKKVSIVSEKADQKQMHLPESRLLPPPLR